DTGRLLQLIRTTPGVAEAAPVLFQHALVTTERNTTGTEVMVKGIEASRARNSPMLAKIVGPRGAFDTAEGEAGVAVGKYLATRTIASRTERRYAVSDWRDMNRQLFSMLKIQQLVLFIVIGLIVFVSTFNIVSTLIMTVHEKRKEIGILSSMGAEPRTIRRIF